MLVEGPYGRLSPRARTRPVALIGAGVGITPLRALAEGLDYAPGDAVLLHRFTDQPLFAHEIDGSRRAWAAGAPAARRAGAPRLLARHGAGTADDLTALRYWVPDIAERDVYVCGPEPGPSSCAASRPPASPTTTSTSRPSRGDRR